VLDEILDYSKLEAGELQCESIDFEPRQLLDSMVDLMSARAEEKGLMLSYSIDDRVPKVLCGDPNHLRQVLLNLIGNAVKFTERGSVCVKLEHMSDTESDNMLRFSVTDSGIGIPDSAREHLFDQFSQVDSSITRRFGGTGLGLAISQHIVEAMGGEINVDSQAGHGSCFYFTIEIPQGQTEIQESKTSKIALSLRKLNILVVDDIELNRQITGDLLIADGHQIKLADSGSTALQTLSHQHFDVILMEVHMPDMDGMQATRQLRAGDDATPVIGLTASIMPEEQAQCIVAGMNAVLAKPIDLVLLSQTMMQLTKGQPADSKPQVDSPLLEQHRLQLGEEKVNTLVNKFWESSSKQLIDIDQALQSGELQLVAECAHRLAGMALSIGFPALGQQAAEFEEAIRKGVDTEFNERFEALKASHVFLNKRWQQEGFMISDSDFSL
jgi:CheY-like chemotaxis protein